MEGWWYEGAGIYRHVWLVKRAPVHIVTDGVHATRAAPGRPLERAGRSDVGQHRPSDARRVTVEAELLTRGREAGGNGARRRRSSRSAAVAASLRPAGGRPAPLVARTARRCIALLRPSSATARPIDERRIHIGFRTFRFDAGPGFFLNGQPLKIKGVCNHQDHAGVGVAVPDSLWECRLRR